MSINPSNPGAKLGADAEELATRYLRGRGFRILDRNWRRPWGELDIIAEQSGAVHFVEVKAQVKEKEGFEARYRVDRNKTDKLLRTARTWLAQQGRSSGQAWQIDIVEVTVEHDSAKIRHFSNITA
jgi:putative endonuclease